MSEPLVPGRISPTADPEGSYRRKSSGTTTRTALIMTFLLLFLVAGLVALGWLVWQQQQSMQQMSDQLTEAHSQVRNLSAQLSVTETNMTESATVADEQIAVNVSEIAKLWDVSNKRNKAWIQTNQANIANNAEEGQKLGQSLTQIETDLSTTLTQVLRQQRDLTDKINVVTAQNQQLSETVKWQVDQNTQSVEAIDQSRQQNNQRILDTERRVSNLERRLSELSP